MLGDPGHERDTYQERADGSDPTLKRGRRLVGATAQEGTAVAGAAPSGTTYTRREPMTHLVSLALILLATSPVAADPIPPAALGPRTLRFTYEARITPPDGAHEIELWLPLPREDDQRVLDVRLTGTAPATIVRLFPAGDRAAYLRIAAPKGPVTLAATATVARREVRIDATDHGAATAQIDPAIFAADLAPDGAVQINDEVRAIARRETRGKKTVTAQARALY